MPKFSFECVSCQCQFTRTLKMGNHPTHPCPMCETPASRLFEGFGYEFAASPKAAPGNTGVAKDDYPTADHAVGKSATARWDEIRARDDVKNKVRSVGNTHALIRTHGDEKGKSFVEYEAGGQALIEKRKKIVNDISAVQESKKTR